jgi:5'-3' exonuclease
MRENKKIVLLDASIYIFRAYFALPDNWHAANGYSINAVYGYTRFLIDLLVNERPEYIFAAFDESLGSCFRNDIYTDYKASRVLPEPELAFQLKLCQEITQALGVACKASNIYEADDLLATVAVQARRRGVSAAVISADKDLVQLLVNDNDYIHDYGRKDPVYPSQILAETGIHPSRWAELLAIAGDVSDDIPGVPGVGIKTAAKILAAISFKQVINDPSLLLTTDIRGVKGLVAKLIQYQDQIQLAYQLTQLKTDSVVTINWRQTLWQKPTANVADYLEELGLKGLGSRLERGNIIKY